MKFLPVRLNTLRPDAPVAFDVYVPVGDRKVHYIRAADPFEGERITKLKEKKLRKLFIADTDEPKYLAYLDAGLAAIAKNDAPVAERAQVANDAMVTLAENAEHSFESQDGFKRTEGQVTKVIEFLMSDRGAMKSVLDGVGVSPDLFQHAATVAQLSLSLAAKAGIVAVNEQVEIGVAALVHDMGKKKFQFDPLKKRTEMTPEEVNVYEQHPTYAVELLSGKPFITSRILAMVADHEEIGRGRGFPNKKEYAKLPLPSKVLNLCNDFDRFCIENGLVARQAIDPFFEKRAPNFDEELIGILATILT